MRVISCSVENFASYKDAHVRLADRGLILVHGATGSGKSTLCDMVPWTLFGKSSKDGAVDEVLSWNSSGTTMSHCVVETSTGIIDVVRSRSRKPKDNDLSFTIDEGVRIRGKDLKDTQRLLEERLGVTYNLYLAGAYLHEFSQSAHFFTLTAQQRRVICEQIVDLTFTKSLATKVSEQLRSDSKELLKLTSDVTALENGYKAYKSMLTSVKEKATNWEHDNISEVASLRDKYTNFKKEIEAKVKEVQSKQDKINDSMMIQSANLDEIMEELHKLEDGDFTEECTTCGAPSKEVRLMLSLKQDASRLVEISKLLVSNFDSFERQITALTTSRNPYAEQIRAKEMADNPHLSTMKELETTIAGSEAQLARLTVRQRKLEETVDDLGLLQDATTALRTSLINNAIHDVEDSTNYLLSTYFDAEIKVEFKAEDADKLDVTIQKDGNLCAYTQLSKGQRGLLKLCFGISIMKQVAKYSSVNFRQVFFDEALDGLDETLKVKAYRLLEALSIEYDSVFVVEHSSELKALFPKRTKIQLVNGHSEINDD